jgi:hypothetical protein
LDIAKFAVKNTFFCREGRRISACLFLVTTEHEDIFKCFHFIQAKLIQRRLLLLLPSICEVDKGLFIVEFSSRFCYVSVELQLL